MAGSFNWKIVEFLDSQREAVARVFGDSGAPWLRRGWTCRKPKCGKPAEVFVAYNYVTGKRGRVGVNERPHCREHAELVIARKRLEGLA